jgi:ribulose-5-phosphate 4-epimerase/fuculose-1-phosphate aldolase
MNEFPQLTFKSLQHAVSPEEWQARVNCACAYRLVHYYEMHDMVYNHISTRVPGKDEHFLLNPFGMLYDEICASSLIKVDIDGQVIWRPEFPAGLNYQFNPAGYVVHSAIHRARPEVGCIIHTHSLAGMAVSSLDVGLLPLTQTAMRFSRVASHDYEGVVVDLGEQERLVRDLGDCEVMILRNHGLLAVGATVAQAFNNIYRIERACRAQLMAMACNTQLVLPSQQVIDHTNHLYKPEVRRPYGLMEWPAMRRLMDRVDASYQN